MRAIATPTGRTTERSRPLGRWLGYIVFAAGLGGPVTAYAQSQPLTLGSTVQALLDAGRALSPEVRAAVLDTAAASAHAEAAGALDDPTLQTSYNRIMRMSELSLTQDIPLWGKRDLRRSAALAAVEVARGRERTAAAELDERIKVAFAQYNAASEALDVNAEVARVTEEMAKAATDRYARGLASQSEALGAQAEQVSVAAEMARLKNQQTSATARLNALLARPAGAPLAHPVGPRALPSSTPKLATLLERTRNASPLLSTQSAEIKGASVEQQLAEKAWNPDVTVGAGAARFDNGELGYTIMLGVKLPLQRAAKDAGAREAAAKLGAARERYAAAAAQIQGDLEEQLAALSTAQNIIDLFRNQQAPQLEAALQSVLAEYQRGGSDFRTVLENEHRLHDVRLTIIRSEVEGETALAAIERLIGGEL